MCVRDALAVLDLLHQHPQHTLVNFFAAATGMTCRSLLCKRDLSFLCQGDLQQRSLLQVYVLRIYIMVQEDSGTKPLFAATANKYPQQPLVEFFPATTGVLFKSIFNRKASCKSGVSLAGVFPDMQASFVDLF